MAAWMLPAAILGASAMSTFGGGSSKKTTTAKPKLLPYQEEIMALLMPHIREGLRQETPGIRLTDEETLGRLSQLFREYFSSPALRQNMPIGNVAGRFTQELGAQARMGGQPNYGLALQAFGAATPGQTVTQPSEPSSMSGLGSMLGFLLGGGFGDKKEPTKKPTPTTYIGGQPPTTTGTTLTPEQFLPYLLQFQK